MDTRVMELPIDRIVPPIDDYYDESEIRKFSNVIVKSNGFIVPLVIIKTSRLSSKSKLYNKYKEVLSQTDSEKYIIVDGVLRFAACKLIREDNSIGEDLRNRMNMIRAIELSDEDNDHVDDIKENLDITKYGLDEISSDDALDTPEEGRELVVRKSVSGQIGWSKRGVNRYLNRFFGPHENEVETISDKKE